METVLISGGTGMIGSEIAQALLGKGYRVIILTRKLPHKNTLNENLAYALWNLREKTIDEEAIKSTDHILHLAGEGIADKRWTAKRKQQIVESRVKSGELLVEALKTIPHKVRTFTSAAATGWYGPDPVIPNPSPFIETSHSSDDFLGQTCRAWEASVQPVQALGIKLTIFRQGIVLSNKGGAMKRFKLPVRFGLATILGTGRQVISWIHIDDLVRLYINSIEKKSFSGIYNAVSPQPVSNKNFMLTLARKIKGRFFIPIYIPAFLLKLIYGELSIEVLKSVTVSSQKLKDAGFTFQYPSIDSALGSA